MSNLPNGFWYLLGGAAICLVTGFMAQRLASKKGYEGYFWTGFLLGVFGLLYVIGLPLAPSERTDDMKHLVKLMRENQQ